MTSENELNPPDKICTSEDMYDNRDLSETWLRIPGVGIVVVHPRSLLVNALENLDPDDVEVQNQIAIIKAALERL